MTNQGGHPIVDPNMALTVQEYQPIAVQLDQLRSELGSVVYLISDPKGLAECRKARARVVKCRTGLESMRKLLKAEPLERCRAIDAEAKAITAQLLEIEVPLDRQVKEGEALIEARREQERKAREEAMSRGIAIMRNILSLPAQLRDATSGEIGLQLEQTKNINMDELCKREGVPDHMFMELESARLETVSKLQSMQVEVVQREQMAAERAKFVEEERIAEEERQAQIRKELEERENRAQIEEQRLANMRAQIDADRQVLVAVEDQTIVAPAPPAPIPGDPQPSETMREQYRQEYTALVGRMDHLTLDWAVRVSPPVREAAADWMISIACLPDDTSTEEILHSVLAARRQICQLALEKAADIWIDKRERELFERSQDMSADDYR